jgi:two-component system, chemotaxis family, chemotaxis protein CheY
MTKKVLSIGNCRYDHGRLANMLNEHFRAEVVPARHADEALEKLCSQPFDLVLVNRVLHRNGQPGLEVIRRLKAEPDLAATPVMLLSNLANYQQMALAAGAEPGFGKEQFDDPEVIEELRRYLE